MSSWFLQREVPVLSDSMGAPLRHAAAVAVAERQRRRVVEHWWKESDGGDCENAQGLLMTWIE
jgi:hypothetical protein